MSKFKVWIDVPENQIKDANAFANAAQRIIGFQPQTIISSVFVNSALRQANLVAVALMEAINAPDELDLTSSVDSVKQAILSSIKINLNLENGKGTGSLQQGGYGKVLGAIASGVGAVAFGGQRYDKIGKPVSEEPQTEAKGTQSFAVGGGCIAYSFWDVAMGKDCYTHQKASFAMGGGNTAGNPNANENDYAFAFCAGGHDNRAVGYGSLVGGGQNVVGDSYGFAMGQKNRTADKWSATFGYNNDNAGQRSTIINGRNMFVYQGADDCLLAGANHEA